MKRIDRLKGLLASPIRRYTASIIDGAIVMAFVLGLHFFGTYKGYEVGVLNSFVVFSFVVKLLAYTLVDVAIPYLTEGKTIGRMATKITLYEENGETVSIGLLSKRASIFIVIALISDVFFFSTISFIIWGFVFASSIYLIYTDILRQTIHDKIARSVMLDDQKLIEDKSKGK